MGGYTNVEKGNFAGVKHQSFEFRTVDLFHCSTCSIRKSGQVFDSAMVTVGQHVYNSLILLAYNYFAANVPQPKETDVHPDEGLTIVKS